MGKIGTSKSGISKKKSPRLQSQKRTTARPLANPPYCQSHEKWTQRTDVEPKNRVLSRLRPLTSNSSNIGLARTLEEYERLLGLPLAKTPHYFYRGHYPSWALVAKVGVIEEEEEPKRFGRNAKNLSGGKAATAPDGRGLARFRRCLWTPSLWNIPISSSGRLHRLDGHRCISGQERQGGESYHSNTGQHLLHSELMLRILRCCTYLLYLWMIAHLFHNKWKMACLIEDFQSSWIKTMSKLEWTQCLEETSEKRIMWRIPERSTYGHPRRYQLQPSVVGYPMILLAPEEAIAPFVIHGMGAHNSEYFKRIRHAWKSIVKKGLKWGALSAGLHLVIGHGLEAGLNKSDCLSTIPNSVSTKPQPLKFERQLKPKSLKEH
ncbi:hypothetical protein CR513_58887, partial [Mucuna pruriens]